ncbi:DUF6504 family protein [Pseudoclavibacter sp. CFCC 11306]|uniref:DUF6504 family protein n=1 Tax=Pseudoclavibacter sp. CFCC 11306 TaxID=1564493 RepID=UPI001300D084|nr:DUF6504 family protein [Pseudoclavibacter sp. CFCC 11306]KAB1658501.1 hypothetical protein F8O09_02490 [Pseudoclavibacter sp. CFCC 11306]
MMPRKIDEAITVELSHEGEPRSFVWRRFEYEIVGVPQSFFHRRRWWCASQSSPAASAVSAHPTTSAAATACAPRQRVDQELWRVDASCTGDDFHTYDLLRLPDDGWRLQLVWE